MAALYIRAQQTHKQQQAYKSSPAAEMTNLGKLA